jgi:hypothetical protein
MKQQCETSGNNIFAARDFIGGGGNGSTLMAMGSGNSSTSGIFTKNIYSSQNPLWDI